jgi:predicted signal transduction protein with EAL and GGDEF domain
VPDTRTVSWCARREDLCVGALGGRDFDFLALYKAKAVGKNGYVLFESAMQTVPQDRIHLEMDLADALDRDQLFLVYQPMLDLRNEQVVGVEALLRWGHPERSVISPDAVIPIAEDS